MIRTVFTLLFAFFLLLPLFPFFIVIMSLSFLMFLFWMNIWLITRSWYILDNVIVVFMLLVFLLVLSCRRWIENTIFFRKLSLWIRVLMLRYNMNEYKLTGTFGWRRNPASCTELNASNSFPHIGGLSITLRSELLSFDVKRES